MFRALPRRALAAGLLSVSLASATPAAAINLFSVQQDAEVGRQAAQDAERQLPMLRDGISEGTSTRSCSAWRRSPPVRGSPIARAS